MALVNNGDSQTFSYTGNIQSITLTKSGVYKLECWGGGNTNSAYDGPVTAKGGYACGYKFFDGGTTLYIVVGGGAGYNGGGSGTSYHNPEWAYVSANNGSGATHIAKVTGLLSEIGETSFCNDGNGFLIAGGAGGCATYSEAFDTDGDGRGDTFARKGGDGGTGGNNGYFGYGNSHSGGQHHHGPGGGAGYRGGLAADSSGSQLPSGGGSGGTNWTAGCPEFTYAGETYSPSSSSAIQTGNGQAKITLVKSVYTVTINKSFVQVEGATDTTRVVGAGEYADGESATLVAILLGGAFHYRFDGWYLNNTKVSSNLSLTITVSSDVTYVAKFVQQGTITAVASPSGTGVFSGTGTFDVNTVQNITATPSNGFAFVQWTVNGETSSSNPYAVTVTGDIQLTATFTTAYEITTKIIGEGSIDVTYAVEGITITATPATHWGFSIIEIDTLDNLQTVSGEIIETVNNEPIMVRLNSAIYTTNPLTLSITSDIDIEVTFIYIGKQFTRYIYGIGGWSDETVRGNILGSTPSGIYDSGTSITANVGSNGMHHTFRGWYANEEDARNEVNAISTSYNYTFTITEDTTLVAKFLFNYPWIPLITNRTTSDITNRTEKAYLNCTDMLRLEKDLSYMESYYNIPLDLDLNWVYGRFIYQSDFTRLLNRLVALKEESGIVSSIPIHPINNYSKMNAFEKTLDFIHDTIV